MDDMDDLDLKEVTRIVEGAAREQSDALEVLGVTPAGGGHYAEVLLSLRGCPLPPCQIALGVFRNVPESELRAEFAKKLRQHLEEHSGQ
jgi:hypothetical protein